MTTLLKTVTLLLAIAVPAVAAADPSDGSTAQGGAKQAYRAASPLLAKIVKAQRSSDARHRAERLASAKSGSVAFTKGTDGKFFAVTSGAGAALPAMQPLTLGPAKSVAVQFGRGADGKFWAKLHASAVVARADDASTK